MLGRAVYLGGEEYDIPAYIVRDNPHIIMLL